MKMYKTGITIDVLEVEVNHYSKLGYEKVVDVPPVVEGAEEKLLSTTAWDELIDHTVAELKEIAKEHDVDPKGLTKIPLAEAIYKAAGYAEKAEEGES